MNARQIADIFNSTFRTAQVVMRGDAEEPLYLPGPPAEIRYARDHAASALHEAAHWCIAGRRRRDQPDFGYFYVAPPRSEAQRQAFMLVECRVQALESIFADAARATFEVSADDFDMPDSQRTEFGRMVVRAKRDWLHRGIPRRAVPFRAALARAGQVRMEAEAACRRVAHA